MRTGAPFESSNRHLPFPFAHDAPGLAFNGSAGTHGAAATLPVGALVDAVAVLPPYRVYAGGGFDPSSAVRLFLYSISKSTSDGRTFATLTFRDQRNTVPQLSLSFEPAALVMSRGGYGRLRSSNVSTGASITLLVTGEFIDYVAGTIEGVHDVFGTTLPLSPETVDFDCDHVLSFSVHNTHDAEFRSDPQAGWATLASGIPGTIRSDVFFVPGHRMGIVWAARYDGVLATGDSERPFRVRGPGGDRMRPHNVVFSVQPRTAGAATTAANLLTYLPDGDLRDALSTEIDGGVIEAPPCPQEVRYDYLRSFSVGGVKDKILPDPTGNVNVVVDGCFHLEAGGDVSVPEDARSDAAVAANPGNAWLASSILLANTCDACCGCDKYYRVGMAIRKLALGATELRDAVLGYIAWTEEFTAKVVDDVFSKLLVGATVAPNAQCDFSASDEQATVRVVTLSIQLGNPNTPFQYGAPEELTYDPGTGLPVPSLRTAQGSIGECHDVAITFADDQTAWLLRQVSRRCVGGRISDEGTQILPWNTPVHVVTPIQPRKAVAVYVAFHALRDTRPAYSYPATIPLTVTYKVATDVAGTADEMRSMSYNINATVEVT